MLSASLHTLPDFAAFFAVATIIIIAFLWAYIAFTPYDEIALIRTGNSAAAVSLGGTMLGFVIPVSNVIKASHDLVSLAVWACIACVIQILTYVAVRAFLPTLAQDIPAGKMSAALFLAFASTGVGMITAACMY